ncbi:type II toxin-antitoxin system HicB family antitoxin [Nitrosomonas communis]|uniref:type II toxin-antitoxin system HicB family antitoxin n=1 Tax=Nitrosomonas communis TaxID=44574 RepID=UPI003D2AD818
MEETNVSRWPRLGVQSPQSPSPKKRGTKLIDFSIEFEQEEDGRWLAEVPQLAGVLAYGTTPGEAMAKAEVLVLWVLAEQLEHGEIRPQFISISLAAT